MNNIILPEPELSLLTYQVQSGSFNMNIQGTKNYFHIQGWIRLTVANIG